MNLSLEVIEKLEKEGYFNIVEIPYKGICGLYRFIFTTGLVYNIDFIGYEGRYCYSNLFDAKKALDKWNGINDPDDEFWIKHKGFKKEYPNPKNNKNYENNK